MSRTFFFWGDSRPIAQQVDGTIYWYRTGKSLVPLVHYLADRPGIVDSTGQNWTGDEFWGYTGTIEEHVSRVGQAVSS